MEPPPIDPVRAVDRGAGLKPLEVAISLGVVVVLMFTVLHAGGLVVGMVPIFHLHEFRTRGSVQFSVTVERAGIRAWSRAKHGDCCCRDRADE